MTALDQTAVAAPARSSNRAWRKLKADRSALVGLSIIVFFTLLAIAAPLLPIVDPLATSWTAIRKAPSAAHWMGTDDIGRDILSRMIWGAQASLMAGIFSVAIAIAIGVPFGLISGYFGGWVDQVISRITEAFLALPFLIMAIALAAFLGPSLTNAMIAIGLSAMPVFVRLTRGQVLAVRTEDYVEGARSIGLGHFDIMTRYILPNIMAPIIVQATLTVATAIIAEASLSFLGLGQQPPAPSWGSMLNVAKNFLDQAPWMAMWPGAAIFLVVIGFNLLGDGLRDALDPRES
ncbi:MULTISPECIES: ABC transporter permease [Alphaproteobacteria]|uniref:Peptide ABC transporter permease n=2 Tax=Alphaproteobacteria TaxID=28211 RepID=A0A512HLH9_9HYPH|nr:MULTISPECIES: ABC transporter permease [Alphaproteobacteria]GEO86260.1 peptide ABC transporter permease [Ciceribacter naphthalenivorans]GLR21362.1 peptide ABC transporter permease [Ciceribacter naphthalenivorans]GLT04218.1 peptide ABC transporter permease [Sphingomonas psychrolutea]